MKKIITLTLVSIVSLFFVGCEKEKEKEKEEFSLVGKTYATMSPHIGSYDSWRFFSETEIEITWRTGSPNGSIIDIKYGTYILNYPKLIVSEKSSTYECEFINENCFRTKFSDGFYEFHLQ